MQTPKSILLHPDCSARSGERIQSARQLAETSDAGVTGLPCMLSALMRHPFAIEAVAIMHEID